MNKKLILLLLIGIVLLAAVLRIWQLGFVPPSPDWDEASLGYNAYSILHTGKDEFGKSLPVVLRSFNDYKPALYAYFTIPSILVFGLSAFAVRLPSAIFGVLTVLATFFLVKELFQNYKYKETLSIIAGFLMAISPWSIQFSRVAFESNIGTSLNIFSALFFLKGLKKPWALSLSAVFAALSVYAYQSEKVFTPLLIIILCIIYRKQLLRINRKYLFSAIVVGLVFILPMIISLVTDKSALSRLQGTSVFSSQTEVLKINSQNLIRDKETNNLLGQVLDNRRLVYAKAIINGYLSHYDLNWLFITGDIARHHAPNMGLLYLFELPLILSGLYFLVFGEFDKKTKLIIFAWFLIAPIPASITNGVPSAVRTLNFLPIWQIFSGLGFLNIILWIRDKKLRLKTYDLRSLIIYLSLISYVLFSVINVVYYLDQYFVQQNYYNSLYWQYGYKQVVKEASYIGKDYKNIVVSNKQPLDNSYIFFLFYLKYPPRTYQNTVSSSFGAYGMNYKFDKFEFRPVNLKKDTIVRNTLYIIGPYEETNNLPVKKTIYNLDGSVAFKMIGT